MKKKFIFILLVAVKAMGMEISPSKVPLDLNYDVQISYSLGNWIAHAKTAGHSPCDDLEATKLMIGAFRSKIELAILHGFECGEYKKTLSIQDSLKSAIETTIATGHSFSTRIPMTILYAELYEPIHKFLDFEWNRVLASIKTDLETIPFLSLRFASCEEAALKELATGDALLERLTGLEPLKTELSERFKKSKDSVFQEIDRLKAEHTRLTESAAAKAATDTRNAELMRRLAEQEECAARAEAERDAARVRAATFEAAAADAAKARSATPSRPRPTAVAGGAGARPSSAASSSRTSFLRSPAASGGLPTTTMPSPH